MGIILLDIGNVIVEVDFNRFCSSVSRHGAAGAERLFNRYCVSEVKLRFDKGLVAPAEYLSMMAGDPDIRRMPVNELKTAWQDIFTLKEGIEDALLRFRDRHAIWITSDTDPLHFTFLLNNFPVLKQADRYLLSYEHGYLKREPGAFHQILGSVCSRQPDEFLLIDDREDNCRCADACGIPAHLFTGWPRAFEELGYF